MDEETADRIEEMAWSTLCDCVTLSVCENKEALKQQLEESHGALSMSEDSEEAPAKQPTICFTMPLPVCTE